MLFPKPSALTKSEIWQHTNKSKPKPKKHVGFHALVFLFDATLSKRENIYWIGNTKLSKKFELEAIRDMQHACFLQQKNIDDIQRFCLESLLKNVSMAKPPPLTIIT